MCTCRLPHNAGHTLSCSIRTASHRYRTPEPHHTFWRPPFVLVPCSQRHFFLLRTLGKFGNWRCMDGERRWKNIYANRTHFGAHRLCSSNTSNGHFTSSVSRKLRPGELKTRGPRTFAWGTPARSYCWWCRRKQPSRLPLYSPVLAQNALEESWTPKVRLRNPVWRLYHHVIMTNP